MGDPTITFSDMLTKDTFDHTIQQVGTLKIKGPYGIPNEIIKYLPT
jgi:hypothetical protein